MSTVQRKTPLNVQATELLRHAIVSGELKPGERYSMTELGDGIGVSRTPIREAVIELTRLGLVEVEANRGIRVRPTSVEALLRGFEIRLMLEVPLARKSTLRRDEAGMERVRQSFERFEAAAETGSGHETLAADLEFHSTLLSLADNPRAADLVNQQRNMVLHTGVETVPASRTAKECFDDHQDIYDAFVAGDASAVAAAMQRHIVNTAQLLIAQEARKRPDFGSVDIHDALAWLMS